MRGHPVCGDDPLAGLVSDALDAANATVRGKPRAWCFGLQSWGLYARTIRVRESLVAYRAARGKLAQTLRALWRDIRGCQ